MLLNLTERVLDARRIRYVGANANGCAIVSVDLFNESLKAVWIASEEHNRVAEGKLARDGSTGARTYAGDYSNEFGSHSCEVG